jgi:hypothetical protein
MHRVLLLAAMLCAVGESVAADIQLLPYQVYIPQETFSPYDDGTKRSISLALTSSEEWRKLWVEIEPRLSRDAAQTAPFPLPNLDFSRYTLLVVASGSRPSGGFRVGFETVREYSSHIEVNAYELRPNGADCIVTATVTHPSIRADTADHEACSIPRHASGHRMRRIGASDASEVI